MKYHSGVIRLMAAAAAIYAAAGMCRAAAGIAEENERQAALRRSCELAEARIDALRAQSEPERIRQQAWRQLGMVSPGDVVFFDAGENSGLQERRRTSQK